MGASKDKPPEESVQGWWSAFSKEHLIALYLPAFALFLGLGIAVPALPSITKSFDVSFGVASLVVIVYMVGSAAAALPTGYLLDRIGRRKVILIAPILTALSSFLVVTAGSFTELLVYRFIGGWAAQMWAIGWVAIITDTGGDRQRGRQITTMYGVEEAGRLFGPAVGGFIAAGAGVEAPFIVHGVLSLLAAIPSFTMIKETAPNRIARKPGAAAEPQPSTRSTLADLLVRPVLILFLVQWLVSLTRGTLYGGTLYLYVEYAYNTGPKTLGMLATGASAATIPFGLMAGYFMDRFGRKITVVPGFVLLGFGLGFMALTAWLHLPLSTYVVALIIVHMAQGLTSGAMQTLGSDVAPPHARGMFFGVWRLVGQTGNFMSPTIFAWLSAFSYPASYLFLTTTAIAAALVLGLQVKETLRPGRTKAS